MLSHQRLYQQPLHRSAHRRVPPHRQRGLFGVASVALAGYIVGYLAPRSGLLISSSSRWCCLIANVRAAPAAFGRLRKHGRLVRDVIVAGAKRRGRELAAMLVTEALARLSGPRLRRRRHVRPVAVAGIPLLGKVADPHHPRAPAPRRQCHRRPPARSPRHTNRLARPRCSSGASTWSCRRRFATSPLSGSRSARSAASRWSTSRPGSPPSGGWRAFAKRSFDVGGAAAGLVATAPVLALAAIAIKLTARGRSSSPRPVGRDSDRSVSARCARWWFDAEDLLDDIIDLNEADGPLFKIRKRPAHHAGRARSSAALGRRAAQLLERPPGGDEPGRSPPSAPHETEAWDPLLTERLRVKPGITGCGRSTAQRVVLRGLHPLDLYYVDNWVAAHRPGDTSSDGPGRDHQPRGQLTERGLGQLASPLRPAGRRQVDRQASTDTSRARHG